MKSDSLDRIVKAADVNYPPINSDDYAEEMTAFTADVPELLEIGGDGTNFAFNLMPSIGEHTHGDLDWGFSMSGYGDSEEPYKHLDKVMLRVIERREEDEWHAAVGLKEPSLPSIPHRFTEKDAIIGPVKTSNGPNKQQRGWIAKQAVEWKKARSQALKDRREQAQDWVSNGLNELVDHRDYIAAYGLEGHFSKSIARLEQLKAGKTRKPLAAAE